jgi:hypothetical protein
MTLQVGMVAHDGWVLTSDTQGTLQGQGWVRQTYQTDKILCRNGVATLAWGDECAMIARQAILDRLTPTPTTIGSDTFSEAARDIAVETWKANPGSSPQRTRGIVFASVGHKKLWHLSFGEQAVIHDQMNKQVYGDPSNPVIFFSEEFYRPSLTVRELTLLASHIVLQGARWNAMVYGLAIVIWKESSDQLELVDPTSYIERSTQLSRDLHELMSRTMKDGD